MPTADRLTGQLMFLPDIIGNLGLQIADAQKRLDENYLDGVARLLQMIRRTLGTLEVTAVQNAEFELLAETAARDAIKSKIVVIEKGDTTKDPGKTALAEAEETLQKAEVRVTDAAAGLEAARANADPNEKTSDRGASSVWNLLMALAPSRYQYTETTLDFSADLAETKDSNFQVGIGVGLQAVMINAAYAQSFGYDYRAAARITTKMHAISADPRTTQALLARAGEIHANALQLPDRSEVEQRVWDRTTEIFKSLTGKDAGPDDLAGAEPEPEKPAGGG